VIDWNPWPVRRTTSTTRRAARRPRPGTGGAVSEVRAVALGVRDVLEEHGLRGYPKTSGSRGIHIYVRLEPLEDFQEVRRAALALAREVERRMPAGQPAAGGRRSGWGVHRLQPECPDRTVASAYSVRAVPDARVSCPLEWEEVPDVEPPTCACRPCPHDCANGGSLGEHRRAPGRLDGLLELAGRDEREGWVTRRGHPLPQAEG